MPRRYQNGSEPALAVADALDHLAAQVPGGGHRNRKVIP